MDKGTKVNNKKKRDQNKAIKKKDDKKIMTYKYKRNIAREEGTGESLATIAMENELKTQEREREATIIKSKIN